VQERTTKWIIEHWRWKVPLSPEFLLSLPTSAILAQLENTFKIKIQDTDNIPSLKHRAKRRGNVTIVSLVVDIERENAAIIEQVMIEKPRPKPVPQRSYISKEQERIEWLGGYINVIKSTFVFEFAELTWYNYVVKRTNGEVIESMTYRGVNKHQLQERIEYFLSIDEDTVETILDAIEQIPVGQWGGPER